MRTKVRDFNHGTLIALKSSVCPSRNIRQSIVTENVQDSLLEIIKESFHLFDNTMETSFEYKSGRKRKQSLLEDLEEFIDVIGLDDLGSLEEMEVFSLDHNHNISYSNTHVEEAPKDEIILSASKLPDCKFGNDMMEVKSISAIVPKVEEPALEAGDVDSLLEQFEATAANGDVKKSVKETSNVDVQPKAKETSLPANIIEKLREMRSARKKSILIPPKPTVKSKAKSINAESGGSPKLRRLLQNSSESPCRADPVQFSLEHDYCSVPSTCSQDDNLRKETLKLKSENEKVNEFDRIPECNKTSKLKSEKEKVNEFFDKIPECNKTVNVKESAEKNDIRYDKLPPYLTCFTNKKEYKKSECSETLLSEEEQVESATSETNNSNVRKSRSRSRSRDSVSDCSTCSSCSSCSRSSCDSYSYRRESPERYSNHHSSSHARSRRRIYSSGSPDNSKYRSYSTSSQSSEEDRRRYSKSRSRSRSDRWANKHWKRNPRRSPSYERNHLNRSRSPINRNRYDSYRQPPPRSRNYRSMPQLSSSILQKKRREIEERRVIYVGNIPEGTTRDYLRLRFQKFGHISEVSVHFRDNRDNYGFITFGNQEDAYDAFENGNNDPKLPKFDLCFGGRRQFCRSNYADLDNIEDDENDCWGDQFQQQKQKKQRPLDFDSLLNAAKSRLQT